MPTTDPVATELQSTAFVFKKSWFLIPVAGAALFVLLYLTAAALYPGGSQADVNAKGFSWMHNYWCNLLHEKAINGQPNAARPLGYSALLTLAFSLLSFWTVAAQRLGFSDRTKKFLLAGGLLCVFLLPFLTTVYHDSVINVSASIGLIVMGFIYAALYKRGWRRLFWFGIFNLLLVALNNALYYGTSLYYLPVVQKFTFFSFLLWVCAVSVKLYRQKSEA